MSRTVYYDYMGCEFDPPLEIDEVPQTHYDEIKAMSVEELAEFIGDDPMHDICPNNCHDDLDRPCKVCVLGWLKEATDG